VFRRVLGALAAASALLMSWVAVSQPGSSEPPAPQRPVQLLGAAFRSGPAPVPGGAPGHYLLQHRRVSALFTDTGLAMRLPSRTLASRELGWSVVGGSAVRPQAEARGLRYPGVLPGVELWFEEHAEGVEYGFRAERGADLRRVTLEYAGAQAVRVVEEGRALEVDLGEDVLREEGLHCAQQQADGFLRAVGCRFTDAHPVGRERWAYAIEVDVEDPERPVVVDPVIRWSTYLGGAGDDTFGGMAVTDAGEVFIVGTAALETTLVTVDGLVIPGRGVIVAKYFEDGGFASWRGLQGDGEDIGRSIVVGKDGMVYVAGTSNSTTFGLELNTRLNHGGEGTRDGLVAQLDPVTLKFNWVHFVGTANGDEEIHDMAVGADGGLFLVGQTTALDFPGAPAASTPRGLDAFVTRLSPAASNDGGPNVATLNWSNVMRGANADVAYAVTVGEGGKVYVTGKTASTGLLTSVTRAHAGPEGTNDVFVARLTPEDGGVEVATYLGGVGDDQGRALALKGVSNSTLFVGGTTRSDGFPSATGASLSQSNAFVVTLDRGTLALKGASLLGGSGDEEGLTLAVDRSAAATRDIVYLGGKTSSRTDFPRKDAFDPAFGDGLTEGFVALMEVDAGIPLLWSSLVGGGGEDEVLALRSDLPGRLFVGGTTTSDDLVPLGTPGYSKNPFGQKDLFLMRVDPDVVTPDAGTGPGTDAGVDAGNGGGGTDAGVDAGNGGGEPSRPDGGTGTEVEPLSPLGWSCGASSSSGGSGTLALGSLVGLVLLACRRRGVTRSR
jgi:hypothetical protein